MDMTYREIHRLLEAGKTLVHVDGSEVAYSDGDLLACFSFRTPTNWEVTEGWRDTVSKDKPVLCRVRDHDTWNMNLVWIEDFYTGTKCSYPYRAMNSAFGYRDAEPITKKEFLEMAENAPG